MDHADHLIKYFAEIPFDAQLGVLEKSVANVLWYHGLRAAPNDFVNTIDERLKNWARPTTQSKTKTRTVRLTLARAATVRNKQLGE
jgi:hypothetical protein